MSNCVYLCCEKCREYIWTGQTSYPTMVSREDPSKLLRFLDAHMNCRALKVRRESESPFVEETHRKYEADDD